MIRLKPSANQIQNSIISQQFATYCILLFTFLIHYLTNYDYNCQYSNMLLMISIIVIMSVFSYYLTTYYLLITT